MPDSYIKTNIINGIRQFGLNNSDPYKLWRDNLFETVDPKLLESVVRDDHFVFVLGVSGVWNRFEREWHSWPPDHRNVASKVWFISLLYSSFVYPRDEVMKHLINGLPVGFLESRLCSIIFGTKNNEYYHIRNAVAHGHIDFSDDTDEVVLKDNFQEKKWEQRYKCGRLLLDSFIITDIFGCIFERAKRDSLTRH